MDIDIKKNGKINLKDTPYYEPIDNTNISFSNMDIGTAMITFQIKKNGLPLQVSKKNVWVYAYLESKNGTRSEVTELNVIDPFEGKVALQLDKEFLIGATNSTVEGQLYITLHKFNDVSEDFSDTVALQKFTFTVQDALINTISGVTKTEYIRTFDQLKTEVKDKIEEMQENIGNIETLVERVNTAAQDAINKVNDTKDAMIKDMQAQYDETEADLTELRETSIQKLDLAAANYINDIKNAKDELVQMISDENLITTQKFEEYKSDLDEEIQMKLQEYEDFINANKNDFEGIINALNWQKYPLTNEYGRSKTVSLGNDLEKLHALEPGFYYTTSTPITNVSSTAGYTHVIQRGDLDNSKHITFRPCNSSQVFLKRFYNDWNDWEKITNNQTDTGWVEFNLINGATSNTEYTGKNGFKCAYRTVVNGTVTTNYLRLNGRNITDGQIIARIPSTTVKNAQSFIARTRTNSPIVFITVYTDGSIALLVNETTSTNEWGSADYIYGEFSWTN